MKQTAVEWLVEKINYHKAWANPEQLEPLIEQAKEMSKQQMIEFGYACTKQIEMNEAGELLMVKSPEQLYNEMNNE